MPEMNAGSRLQPSRYVRATVTAHGGMLLDLRERRGRWYALTPAAALWWQHIQDGRTAGQASQAVADRYRITPARATADLEPFLAILLEKRLLNPAPPRRTTKRRQRP